MGNYSKAEINELLHKSTDIKIISDTLLYVTFNVDDVDWIEDCCLSLINCDNDDISGLAITCLGHVARIHSKINKEKVIPVLMNKKSNHNLIGRIEDAMDDINMFAID